MKRLALAGFVPVVLGLTTFASPAYVSAGAASSVADSGLRTPSTGGATPGEVSPGLRGARKFAIAEAVGQMLIGRMEEGSTRASPSLKRRIRDGQLGAVILFSSNIASKRQLTELTSEIQGAARRGDRPAVFIGVDQEGGLVKRIPFAPPAQSAYHMGASPHPEASARSEGRDTGEALRGLGINLDFAPVADVPSSTANFLAKSERAFGFSPAAVVRGAAGFAQGLAEAGLVGSAKHFPGLGFAGGTSTDEATVIIHASAAALRADYAPYLAMDRMGRRVAPMVMISNAVYPTLGDPVLPADLSAQIVHDELPRAHLTGRVVITDDLEVPAVARYGRDVVRWAVNAGDDMLMFATHESRSSSAYREILDGVRSGLISKHVVFRAAARVLALKREFGLRVPQ